MCFLKQNRLYHKIISILLTLVLFVSLIGTLSLVGLCDEADLSTDVQESGADAEVSQDSADPFYMTAFVAVKDFLKTPIGLLCLAVAVVIVLIVIVFMIQWARVVRRKKNPKEVDWSSEARQSIEQARRLLENGLFKALRSEFGDNSPSDPALLQKFVSDAYGIHAGGLYISVDALSAFVRQIPSIFLQGSDSVGGESVLTLLVNETSGERFFYLDGLSICYHREGYRRSVRYNIRFSLEKPNRPIEEVLEFEVV